MQQLLSAILYAVCNGDLMCNDSKFVILEEYMYFHNEINSTQLGEKNK